MLGLALGNITFFGIVILTKLPKLWLNTNKIVCNKPIENKASRKTMINQFSLTLPARKRGFHLVTQDIIQACGNLPQTGLLSAFIQHTSASLSINENADPTVRDDLEAFSNNLVPENTPYFTHTYEGSDDMPAHIKAAIFGCSVSIPIMNGELALGMWQGIYLGEHRNKGGNRRLIISVMS